MYANYVEHEQQEIMSTSSFCFLVFAAASEKENFAAHDHLFRIKHSRNDSRVVFQHDAGE